MEISYRPEAWHELYVALCGSAAALAGLLFLATSMHIEEIVRRPRTTLARASNNTAAIMFIFVEAALVLIPQSATFAGSEVVMLNLTAFASLAGNNIAHRLARKINVPFRLVVGAFTWVIGLAGGTCLIFQRGEGMYLVTTSVLYGLASLFTTVGQYCSAFQKKALRVDRKRARDQVGRYRMHACRLWFQIPSWTGERNGSQHHGGGSHGVDTR